MNTLKIKLNGTTVEIEATFTDAKIKALLNKTNFIVKNNTAKFVGHVSWLGEYLPILTSKYQCNFTIVEAPAELVEKHNLTVVEPIKAEKTLLDHSPTANAIEMLNKMTDEQYTEWNRKEMAKINNKPSAANDFWDTSINGQVWDD